MKAWIGKLALMGLALAQATSFIRGRLPARLAARTHGLTLLSVFPSPRVQSEVLRRR